MPTSSKSTFFHLFIAQSLGMKNFNIFDTNVSLFFPLSNLSYCVIVFYFILCDAVAVFLSLRDKYILGLTLILVWRSTFNGLMAG